MGSDPITTPLRYCCLDITRRITMFKRLLIGRRKQVFCLFDVTIGTDNLGDEIIMLYGRKAIAELMDLSRYKEIDIATHTAPNEKELREIQRADVRLVCGTNIICPNLKKYSLWRFPENPRLYHDVIGMGIGMNSYGDIDEYSAAVYSNLFHKKLPVSVRDEYTKTMLGRIGMTNVINTHCVSMWNRKETHLHGIPEKKPENVVFTLTAHRRDRTSDLALIRMLRKNYRTVYFWPQGEKDLEYLRILEEEERTGKASAGSAANELLTSGAAAIVLPRTLSAFENLLKKGDTDYIGTRLHGGIHALNLKARSFIIIVDNRAAEISRDTNLPCFSRQKDWSGLEKTIREPYRISLNINWQEIEKWKQAIRHYIANV